MLIKYCAVLYDQIHARWESYNVVRNVALVLVYLFIFLIIVTLLNINELLPAPLSSLAPTNIFYPVQLVFTVVLLIEVIELIFALSDSVSFAVRKQLEVMAIILLRDAFKDISLLNSAAANIAEEPLLLIQVISTAMAGCLLFIIRGVFLKKEFVQQYAAMGRYRCAKKGIALALLVAFVISGVYDLYAMSFKSLPSRFFQLFYTALLFSDILIILAGQYFTQSFHVIFRNSGYAVGTLIMRIALGTPHHISAALCVFAGCYILLVAWATCRYQIQERDGMNIKQSL